TSSKVSPWVNGHTVANVAATNVAPAPKTAPPNDTCANETSLRWVWRLKTAPWKVTGLLNWKPSKSAEPWNVARAKLLPLVDVPESFNLPPAPLKMASPPNLHSVKLRPFSH